MSSCNSQWKCQSGRRRIRRGSTTAKIRKVHAPGIIYGTAWKGSDTARLVTLAIQTGFRAIDTACQPKHYDEAGVGAGVIAGLSPGLTRAELYLQTKFTSLSGQDPDQVPYDREAPLPHQVAQSVAKSLTNLQTDYLDCVLLHSPMPTMTQTQAAWRALEAFVDTGQILRLGISNCYRLDDLKGLYEGARIKPAVVQNRFYADTNYDRKIRAYCDHYQIIYQSFWTLSANPRLLAHKAIIGAAATHKRTTAQILFRYLTQIGVVPLTGTKAAAHMREDLGIFDFDLSHEERSAIDEIL
jgi:diketogulonate reductase-like aldo/keto reductase